ncbi:MAG: O-antigen ligase family protein [Syntrophobacteraceae bacterium]
MELALLGIIAASLIVIASVTYLARRTTVPETVSPDIPVLLLGLWLIASAVWGPYFYSIRLPGVFDISVDRLIFLALLAVLGFGVVSGRVGRVGTISIEVCAVLFSAMCLVSMFRYGFKEIGAVYPSPWNLFLTGYLLPFIVFLFAKHYVVDEKDLTYLMRVLFYLGIYLCITAFFEFFDLRGLVFPRYINDPKLWLHLDRARGPFLNAAFNGSALTFGFVAGIYLLARKRGLGRFFHGLLLLLYFPAIFFTQTRSVYLGFLITLAALFALYRIRSPKWKLFAMPIAIALVGLMLVSPRVFSPERKAGGILQTEEIEIRMALIKRSVQMIQDQPFLGVGLAQFIPESVKRYKGKVSTAGSITEQTQHNHIIGLIVELGLVGAAFYVLILLSLFRKMFRLSDVVTDKGFPNINLLVLLAIMACVYLNNNLFIEPSYCLYFNAVFFMVVGIVDGLYGRYLFKLA